MIRPIKITLNAAHPEVPLIEATTFVGSPSAVFVSGVPATVGLWRITAVKVVAHYPDDSATTVECVKGASGVWTATLPATATSGRVTHGFEILADGLDENGDAVTGYVLGYADFAVFTRDMTIDSGGTLYYMHYFDALPQTPKKGDVAPDGSGGLQLYDGTAWVSMGGYTPPAGGIPKTDLSEGVQASLDKADTALQAAPVTSVNSKTGAVTLTASDVGVIIVDISDGSTNIYVGNEYVNIKNITLSTNQYGNRVIWLGAEEFAVIPVVDLTPQQGSLHAVSSGSVYTALALKAPLASPAFTGRPTAPNMDAQSADGQVANKKYVDDKVAGVSVTPLSGQTFDFATMQGIFAGVKACIEALGGSVTNFPAIPANE